MAGEAFVFYKGLWAVLSYRCDSLVGLPFGDTACSDIPECPSWGERVLVSQPVILSKPGTLAK